MALGTGTETDTPSLAQVHAAARSRATAPAPYSLGGRPPVLNASVGGLTFPDWERQFGWRATGARSDDIGGRVVKTVFYGNRSGAGLGYAIVEGDQLEDWSGGQAVTRYGKTYRVGSAGGRTVVTWTQMDIRA